MTQARVQVDKWDVQTFCLRLSLLIRTVVHHQSRLCLSFLQQFVQQYNVHLMFHHKASIQVEDRYVPSVPVKPHPVLWKTDVHHLEDKLETKQGRGRERDRHLCFCHIYKVRQRKRQRQAASETDRLGSHSVSERVQSFFSFFTQRARILWRCTHTHTQNTPNQLRILRTWS